MLKAVLFDLDNTLVDRDSAVRRHAEATLAQAKGMDPPARREALRQVMTHDSSGYQDRDALHSWLSSRYPVFGADPVEVKAALDQGLVEHLQADPAATQAVDQLRERYSLAVVSNGSSHKQRAKLRRAELEERFEHVLISGELGVSKPDPRIFERALAAVGCDAEEALFVGDHPVNDLAGAALLGMSTCWVARGRTLPSCIPAPTYSVEHVSELAGILT